MLQSIKSDDDLNMQLQYNGMPLPLRQWFVQGHNATLKNATYLGNFAACIRNTIIDT